MKKIFKKIHLWLSIPLGVLITIICLTGAILVFRTEIEEAVNKDLIFTQDEQGEKLSITELVPIVSTQLEDDQLTGVTIPADPQRNYTVSVVSNMRAAVYVNPYTGEVLGKMEGGFFSKVMQLHRWLLIKREVGKPIIGYTTLIMVIILISGLIVIFPKSRKQLKRIFSISFTKGWKRFWYDLHVSGGMYVLIGLLVLALTGLTWSFQWYRKPFYKLFGAEIVQQGHAPQPQQNTQQQNNNASLRSERSKDENQIPQEKGGERPQSQQSQSSQGGQQRRQESLNPVHWDDVLAHIQAENPDYKRINIRNNSATVTQDKWGNSRASDRYTFDGDTGEITEYVPYKDQDRTTKVRGWIYSIHVGSWGGWLSKTITFLVALIGASLPITGYYLWIKRLRRKKGKI